ncbi:AbrB/MazE/SpoVT family DNA-binding domain-containing protein [Candidatus Bipolaricaulota bacterium]|nr:AbrB/MazE/SpoVT family DNA-binding domain-containing protein [Candidatus Bipolaricaulota bacterium]MBS3825852.1 AbrB/MazE/SpoVT family DNA-binding domain-containing protein [Candidatus Bipolaricaulota bacterium]
MSEKATVTKKGQVTIPKKIRDKLGLEEGMKVTFQLKGKEAILLPEVENPLQELRELRKEVNFSEEEIQGMIEESKEEWSKISR